MSSAVQAATAYALIVGASAYRDAAVPELEGASNDALLLYNTLRARWAPADNITVLADGPASTGFPIAPRPPTRQAILSELNRLVEKSSSGDRVMIVLAGHGAQIPVVHAEEHPEEPDGMNEIFLPVDTVVSETAEGILLRNHITDDEMGVVLGALLEKGASVWLVVDSCHSGTFERNSGERGQARFLDLASMGKTVIDGNPPSSDQRKAMFDAGGAFEIQTTRGEGGAFVGFYAAQPGQKTFEMPFQGGAGEPDRVHGVLSYSLARAIAETNGASFSDLARSVSLAYWSLGSGMPDPMFVGNLGATALDKRDTPLLFRVQWQSDNTYVLGAGALAGLEHGSEIEVRLGESSSPLFFARITDLGLDKAIMLLIDDDPQRPNRIADAIAPEGLSSDQQRSLWLADRSPAFVAQAVAPPLQLPLRVAWPSNAGETLRAELDEQAGPPGQPRGTAWSVAAANNAELSLLANDDTVLIVPEPTANLPTVPLTVPSSAINATLDRLARNRNLFRLARMFSRTPTGEALTASVDVRPSEGSICPDSGALAISAHDASNSGRLTVRPCNQVHVELSNSSSSALDISPFYLDPTGQLYYLTGYPDGRFFGLRLPANGSASFTYVETGLPSETNASAADMYLLVFAVPAAADSLYPVDFRFLAGNAAPVDERSTANVGDFGTLLAASAFERPQARSAVAADFNGGALVIPLEVSKP